MIHTLDLNFLEVGGAIAAFVIPTERGGILVETGPYSTHESLLATLDNMGLQPTDIHAVLLTHIHFDHAGAAWWWARQGATVYVHPAGYKHLQNPERLWNSAARIYGDDMDRLWGEMHPIDPAKLVAVADRETLQLDGISVTAHHTPGHAKHHIAWQVGEELLTGDVGGVKIGGGPVVPPCPPPDIDLPAWETSIARIREIGPRRLYLTHYGPVENIEEHLSELETRLKKYAAWMEPHAEAGQELDKITPAFVEFVDVDLREAGVTDKAQLAAYQAANPPWMSVAGLVRYWQQTTDT